jgi:hypothetical protein
MGAQQACEPGGSSSAGSVASWSQPEAGGESAVNNESYAMTMVGLPQRDTTAQLGMQVFTPHLYQRLTHPLCLLIKELNVADGVNVDSLCEFLLKVLRIKEIEHLGDIATHELMFTIAMACFAVEQVIKCREKFEDFHARMLTRFIPSTRKERIRMARYERVQNEGEPFLVYVQAIKDHKGIPNRRKLNSNSSADS